MVDVFFISFHFLRNSHNSQQQEKEREKIVILFTFCDLCEATPNEFSMEKSEISYACSSVCAFVKMFVEKFEKTRKKTGRK